MGHQTKLAKSECESSAVKKYMTAVDVLRRRLLNPKLHAVLSKLVYTPLSIGENDTSLWLLKLSGCSLHLKQHLTQCQTLWLQRFAKKLLAGRLATTTVERVMKTLASTKAAGQCRNWARQKYTPTHGAQSSCTHVLVGNE